MKKTIKIIRIAAFLIILLFLLNEAADTIVACADTVNDAVKIKNILAHMLPFVFILFIVLLILLIKNPGLAVLRVTILDALNIVMFIALLMLLERNVKILQEISSFVVESNNFCAGFYTNGIGGDLGHADMEKMLEDEIERIERTGNHNELKEIYRIQTDEKTFIYYKETDAKEMLEIALYKQDDLYYKLGSTHIMYDWKDNDSFTTEATIRSDIANTMWRGDGNKKLSAPAWGVSVSTDEQIFSMTVNSKNLDNVILIDENDDDRFYFWIITNIEYTL